MVSHNNQSNQSNQATGGREVPDHPTAVKRFI